VNSLLHAVVGIIRLRAGPQDLRYSWPMTIALVAVYLATGMYIGRALDDAEPAATTLAVASLQFTAIGVMLQLRGHFARLPQTLAAVAATGAVLGIVSYLLLSQADPERNQPILGLLWFAVFFWSLAVEGHIYRHAMSITLPQGILVAVLLLAATFVLVRTVLS
jgi:hypothetical protein